VAAFASARKRAKINISGRRINNFEIIKNEWTDPGSDERENNRFEIQPESWGTVHFSFTRIVRSRK
jgi:hypothetical protein